MIRASFDLDLGDLIDLRDKKIRKAIRIGINRAAKPVRSQVKAEAERIALQGFTAKSIGTKQKVYRSGLVVIVVVGPKRSYKRVKGKYTRGKRKGERKVFRPASVAHFVEKGTARSKPEPFLRPALDKTSGKYQESLAAEIKAEIEQGNQG